MSNEFKFANPNLPASKKQTFAIWCLRKKLGVPNPTGDVRTEGLTLETASMEMKRLIALSQTVTMTPVTVQPEPVKEVVFTSQNGTAEISEFVF